MKATGIVRRVDDLGRVMIPKELRYTQGINEGDPLEIFVSGDQIVLRKYAPGCSLCGQVEGTTSFLRPEKLICSTCIDTIGKNQEDLMKSIR